MLSLKTKELSSARDVSRSVCREIRLFFSRIWLIHTKRFRVRQRGRCTKLLSVVRTHRSLIGSQPVSSDKRRYIEREIYDPLIPTCVIALRATNAYNQATDWSRSGPEVPVVVFQRFQSGWTVSLRQHGRRLWCGKQDESGGCACHGAIALP